MPITVTIPDEQLDNLQKLIVYAGVAMAFAEQNGRPQAYQGAYDSWEKWWNVQPGVQPAPEPQQGDES